ncbi:unnamed protein product [Urochloa humidicola]
MEWSHPCIATYYYLFFSVVVVAGRMAASEPPVELGMCWLLAVAVVAAAAIGCSFSPVVSLNKTQLLYPRADSSASASTLHGVLLASSLVFSHSHLVLLGVDWEACWLDPVYFSADRLDSTMAISMLPPAPVAPTALAIHTPARCRTTVSLAGSLRLRPLPRSRLRSFTFWNRGISPLVLCRRLHTDLWAVGVKLPSPSTFALRGHSTRVQAPAEPLVPSVGALLVVSDGIVVALVPCAGFRDLAVIRPSSEGLNVMWLVS